MLLHRKFLQVTSILVILTILFSGVVPQSVLAQGQDGLKRQINSQTGKVSFLGPESGNALSASQALGIGPFSHPADPALALAKRFGPEFGLKNPERDLSKMKTHRLDNGRIMARYQQTYQGIPVMGGELIVNTNDGGDLYSMNGEVSPNLSLSTQPVFDSEQAKQTALQAIAKWYQKTSADFDVSEPALWIYDESLLRPSIRPAELVWRMEVTPKDIGMPVRELVLINAQGGTISLHFNQIDTAWTGSGNSATPQHHQPTQAVNTISEVSASQLGPLAATTWYVANTGNDSNSCFSAGSPCQTINGAIGKASNGDTIKVAIGIYTGTGTEVVLINKSITLSGGWNVSFVTQSDISTVDGQGSRRGITTTGTNVAIDHFLIQNGFNNNQGGGILNNGSTLTLSNSRVSGNLSQGMGGGIFNYGTLTINNTSITNNTNSSTSGAGGGGIEHWGATYILTLNNSLVDKNVLLGWGDGGGIDNNGVAVLNNSTVSRNVGEGISTGGGTLVLNNSTISENQSYGISSYGNLTLRNTIIAGNSTTSLNADCQNGGALNSQGYNLIGNNVGCPFTAATGDLIGTSTNPIDPRLTPLQDNGGSTLTYALMSGSPAIDAGSPATPGSGGNACLATDQREVARPVGTRCDIGAYEGSVPWSPPPPTPHVLTYDARWGTLPGNFLCNQTDPACTMGDSHAQAAHKYAIGTYNLYLSQHQRNSIDNNGMTIISSVHYCAPGNCPYYNASWNGAQMVYGDAYGYPLADDVVAHELTHGVTQYEANLFYYYQSGAINESFSDLWGEYYDQTNGLGTDVIAVKWLLGEDVAYQGALRDMSNPPAFGDPDRISSPNYYEGEEDNGGVHYNSGVNNKAVFLMVDGGTFNSKTVTALSWDKTAAIYYEVNTNLLSSGADYSDLYYALQQACTNVIGQKGITVGDCAEVKDALDAVEMNGQPAPNFNTDAPYCDAGNAVTTIFSDDLEAGTGNWTFTNGAKPRWQVDSPDLGPYAQSGLHSLYADDYPDEVTDASARLKSFFVLNNTYLRFAQAYEFETGYNVGNSTFYNFDGGVLEYSLNNGASWVDAGSLIDFNGYKGTLFTGADNPLSGRSAFVGISHGYISTRLNLSSLAGQTVSFRWRMGLDQAGFYGGWWVDSVQVYTCLAILSKDTTGVFRPSNGLLYLKNSNQTGFADMALNYGIPGDYPVVGDWDGNGDATIGVYRNGKFMLRNSNTIGFAEMVFAFGQPGDQPVAGDWDGDGVDTIGIYRPSIGLFLLRNSNSAGMEDMSFYLGNVGDVGIAGDWDGDGKETTGVFRPSNGIIFLKNTNQTGFADVALNYGIPGDKPVTGDWDNDGIDTIGVYRNGQFMLRNSNTVGFADIVFGLGIPGDMPIAGNWDGQP